MVKKILMVDDDRDFVDACKILLEAAGYEICVESEESKVLGVIKDFDPDLILLDVVMKTKESGFNIAGSISKDGKLKHTPIIFLTGYFKKDMLKDKEKEITTLWPNVRGILDKPVKPAALLNAIHGIGNKGAI